MRAGFACALMLASWGASACTATTSSHEVRTGSLVALIDITAELPDQCVVSADVVLGGQHSNARVTLADGDRLHATCGGERRPMRSLGNGSYEARFARSEGECAVALSRKVDVSAPRSVGTLPVPFDITSDLGEAPISRAHDPLSLSWAPGGTDSEVTIEFEGDCIHSAEFQVTGDPGGFLIEPGRLAAWITQERESCNVAVRIVQLRKGKPDPALDRDSSVVLRQIRTTRFVSKP